MKALLLRIKRLLAGQVSDREIEEELRFHIDMEAAELRRSGLDETEAQRRARAVFGGETRWREAVRDARGAGWIEDAVRDVRLGIRGIARAPMLAIAAIGTIALGVSATTAIYSVVDQVALSPLPYPDSDELVSVWLRNPARGVERDKTSWPNFVDWRLATTGLESIATFVPHQMTLAGEDGPELVAGVAVSDGFFELIGTAVEHARGFRDHEVEGDFANVAVISHELFTRRFGADPAVLGTTIELDLAHYEVVGVAEPGLAYPRHTEVWIPQAFGTGRQWRDPRQRLWLSVVGRLADGIELRAAQREMDTIGARLEADHPAVNRGVGIALEPLHETVVGEVHTPMLVLFAAAIGVLLIATVNVANLLLARGVVTSRELAVRQALGARRGRLVRQVLAQTAVLAGAGGVLGAVLAAAGVVALTAAAPTDLPRLDEVGLDLRVLSTALAATLGASLVFGLVPATVTTRVSPGAILRGAGQGSWLGGRVRLRAVFVIGQFALAFVLLVAAGLLLSSFLNLRAVDPGFSAENALSVGLSLSRDRYPDAQARRAFGESLLENLGVLPDVAAVGTVSEFFVDDLRTGGPVTIESRPDAFEVGTEPQVASDAVSPGFFEAAGMSIVSGRGPLRSDAPEDVPVAVVNETFVRIYLDGLDPVGQRFVWGRPHGEASKWFQIIGVVTDTRRAGPSAPVDPAVFVSAYQRPRRDLEVVIRSTGDALGLVPAVRATIAEIDPDQPVTRLRTLESALADSLAQRRFVVWLLGIFAVAALALAAIGIFGVMAYIVGCRTREFGIRLALGAARRRLLAEVLGQGIFQAAGGLAIGGLLAIGVARVIRGQLFGLEAIDATVFGAASAMLVLVAVAACLVPARRAATVDAVVALRDG